MMKTMNTTAAITIADWASRLTRYAAILRFLWANSARPRRDRDIGVRRDARQCGAAVADPFRRLVEFR
jgi:hypothetical protein